MDRLDIRLCRHYIGMTEEFWDRGQRGLERCLQDSRIWAAKGGAEPLVAGGKIHDTGGIMVLEKKSDLF